MSPSGFPNKWFLELQGKRMGPFSSEQILGLLADGEIPEDLRVTPGGSDNSDSPATGEGSMTASELREAYFQDHRIPTAPIEFRDLPYAPDAPVSGEADPEHELVTARRLFDLFQTAREKRAARFAPTVQASIRQDRGLANHGRMIGAAAAALIVAIAGVWGLTGRESGPDRELARVDPAQETSVASPAKPSAEAPKELPKVTTAPAFKPKAPLRNSWKPGKTVAKVAPPPSAPARADRRDDRRELEEDRDRDWDRNDERADSRPADRERNRDRNRDSNRDRENDRDSEGRPLERTADSWENRDDDQGRERASAPLIDQLATDAGVQPAPPVPQEGPSSVSE